MDQVLIRQLSYTEGFIERYFHHLTNCETQVEAYNRTENEYIAIFTRRRYSNYDSFRIVKNRKIRG